VAFGGEKVSELNIQRELALGEGERSRSKVGSSGTRKSLIGKRERG